MYAFARPVRMREQHAMATSGWLANNTVCALINNVCASIKLHQKEFSNVTSNVQFFGGYVHNTKDISEDLIAKTKQKLYGKNVLNKTYHTNFFVK